MRSITYPISRDEKATALFFIDHYGQLARGEYNKIGFFDFANKKQSAQKEINSIAKVWMQFKTTAFDDREVLLSDSENKTFLTALKYCEQAIKERILIIDSNQKERLEMFMEVASAH